MAIYHCHCKIISRGKGRSAVGAAAYRSGEKIINEYDGIEHDYSRKSGVVYSEIMLCENAPINFENRATLWNEVEKIEKGSNAQLAREYEVALPVELTREEQIQLVSDFVKENFVDKGMCADFSIHDKEDGNPHAHIMLTTRPIEKNGSWGVKATNEYVLDKNGNRILQKIDKQKRKIYKRVKINTRDWNTKEFLQRSRESWAEKINAELEKKNLPQRVDHRSFKEQGKEQIPTQHIGVSANAMEKRGIESKRGNENREIKQANMQIQSLDILSKQTQREIEYIRDDMKWNKNHEQILEIEKKIPTAAGDEKTLLQIQVGLLKVYESARLAKEPKTSENRTIKYDGKTIPYFEYHRTKYIQDISYLQDKVRRSLEELKQSQQKEVTVKQEEPKKQGGYAAKREAFMQKEQPQETPKIDKGYVDLTARKLAMLRNDFVRETIQSKERTSYHPNPIYAKQANEIESISKTMAEQRRTIEHIKFERDKLGMFKGREKKELQGKIDNFEHLYRANEAKLKELGVSDLTKADEAIKEKRTLATAEQDKAKAARENAGATDRAEQAKAAFIEIVKQIPINQRQAVQEQMGKYVKELDKEHSVLGTMEMFKAEIEARRYLDSLLNTKPKGEEHERYKFKGLNHE